MSGLAKMGFAFGFPAQPEVRLTEQHVGSCGGRRQRQRTFQLRGGVVHAVCCQQDAAEFQMRSRRIRMAAKGSFERRDCLLETAEAKKIDTVVDPRVFFGAATGRKAHGRAKFVSRFGGFPHRLKGQGEQTVCFRTILNSGGPAEDLDG